MARAPARTRPYISAGAGNEHERDEAADQMVAGRHSRLRLQEVSSTTCNADRAEGKRNEHVFLLEDMRYSGKWVARVGERSCG